MRVDRNPPFGSFHANLPIFIVNYFSVEAKLFKNCNICDPGCQGNDITSCSYPLQADMQAMFDNVLLKNVPTSANE